jgi:hypothetical protein
MAPLPPHAAAASETEKIHPRRDLAIDMSPLDLINVALRQNGKWHTGLVRFLVIVAVGMLAPREALAGGAFDAARCALDLGDVGVNGVRQERAPAPATATRIRTFSAKEAVTLGKQLTARMPRGVTIQLDRAGMNSATTLRGQEWEDSSHVGKLINEHPCLFGLTATTTVEWTGGDINGLRSTTGYWGLIAAAGEPGGVVIAGHLWPIPDPANVDLQKWRKRFPDVVTHPVRPMCDPVPGGPPDQCLHQHDPEIVTRVFAVRGLRCDGAALVSEDLVLVTPPPPEASLPPFGSMPRPGQPLVTPLGPRAARDDQAFDPRTSKQRPPPPFLLDWNPPDGNTANAGVLSGKLRCLFP